MKHISLTGQSIDLFDILIWTVNKQLQTTFKLTLKIIGLFWLMSSNV